MRYLSVQDARHRPGLRLVLTAHLPAPWGEAAKALFALRAVPYEAVEQTALAPNEDLLAWTGIRNAPVAIYEDEPAASYWLEILLLAERLGSGPSLLPDDPFDRALALGFSCQICGPEGFGWLRRLTMIDPESLLSGQDDAYLRVVRSYGARTDSVAEAPARLVAILTGLAGQIERQRERGSDYLVGDRLSACDVHWACLSQMIAPLAPEDCPMPDWMRANYSRMPAEVANAIDPALIRHRDLIFRRHIGLPLEF